jgi:hypothetical protein
MNEWVIVAAVVSGTFLLMGGGGLVLTVLRGTRKGKDS